MVYTVNEMHVGCIPYSMSVFVDIVCLYISLQILNLSFEFLPTSVCGAGGEPNHQLPGVPGAAC